MSSPVTTSTLEVVGETVDKNANVPTESWTMTVSAAESAATVQTCSEAMQWLRLAIPVLDLIARDVQRLQPEERSSLRQIVEARLPK